MSETEIVVSVITPVYNGAKFIRQTIESVCAQSGVKFEYILVNDGSTDSSLAVIESALRDYVGEYLIITLENGGEARAINVGVDASRGQFLCVVSADDPLLPGHLATMVEVLDQNSACVVAYPDWMTINSEGKPLKEKTTKDYDNRTMIVEFVCIPGPGALIRRRAISEYPLRNPDYVFVSDYEAWLRLSLVGSFVRVPHVLATYRVHENQMTNLGRGQQIALEIEKVIEDFYQRTDLPDEIQRLKKRAKGFAAYYAGIQKLYDRKVKGRRLMIKSLLLAPPHRISWPTVRRKPLGFVAVLLSPMGMMLLSVQRKVIKTKNRRT